MGPLTPTRAPTLDRARTASPIDPGYKKRFRGSLDTPAPRVAPMLPPDAHPFDEEHMGEHAGDGADWHDDLAEWEPPREVRTARDAIHYALVNHVLETKFYWNSFSQAAISSTPTDYMPTMNPSQNTEVNGRIGNQIRVRRLQIQGVFYRNMNTVHGDLIRLVLIKDHQGLTNPPSWLDVFTGGGTDCHSFVRPDRRNRYEVLVDRMYDFPRLFQASSATDNLKHFRIDVSLDDMYMFDRDAFVPDTIRYRLYCASQRGNTGFEGLCMMTYVDP